MFHCKMPTIIMHNNNNNNNINNGGKITKINIKCISINTRPMEINRRGKKQQHQIK